jgi:hypothetical protein
MQGENIRLGLVLVGEKPLTIEIGGGEEEEVEKAGEEDRYQRKPSQVGNRQGLLQTVNLQIV